MVILGFNANNSMASTFWGFFFAIDVLIGFNLVHFGTSCKLFFYYGYMVLLFYTFCGMVSDDPDVQLIPLLGACALVVLKLGEGGE
tara:strand:+ start:572 stop:829 length:258 start_codon:yes stop_codon:yes gene_type:complete